VDTESLLRSLKEHKVKFVIIGATAFPVHGYSRATLDIDDVWINKVKSKFGDTFVWFASLDDLIKMKKAAGRPKDIEDLKYLIKLKD